MLSHSANLAYLSTKFAHYDGQPQKHAKRWADSDEQEFDVDWVISDQADRNVLEPIRGLQEALEDPETPEVNEETFRPLVKKVLEQQISSLARAGAGHSSLRTEALVKQETLQVASDLYATLFCESGIGANIFTTKSTEGETKATHV